MEWRFIRMLLDKSQNPVVVVIHIDLAQNQIGSMRRTNSQDKQVSRKEHDSCQSDSTFLCPQIFLIKLRTLEQLQVIHIRPGMIILVKYQTLLVQNGDLY